MALPPSLITDVYNDVGWDESGREVGVFKDGDVIETAQHTHG